MRIFCFCLLVVLLLGGYAKDGIAEVYVYKDKNGVLTFSNKPGHEGYALVEKGEYPKPDLEPNANYDGRASSRSESPGAVVAILGLIVVAIVCLGSSEKKQTPAPSVSGYGQSDSDSNSTTSHKQSSWPWSDRETIVGNKNIYEKGTFSNTRVGGVRENFWGETIIYKEGFLSSEKVGKIETTIFGNPKSIVDTDGNKVGDVKTTWTGRNIIVDEDGNEIGEYKRD